LNTTITADSNGKPDARLLWTPTEHQSVWAAVSRAVRTPSRLDQDLQLTDFLVAGPPIPIFLRVVGSKQFVSEKLIGSEIGVPHTCRKKPVSGCRGVSQ